MKHSSRSFISAVAMTLLACPVAAWADHNPDFDDDAKPILRMQPGLLQYVESTYQVRDTGMAKIPGNDDRHASPPYIFLAKPRGYPGDYYIKLLIQPGPSGRILKIVDPTQPSGVPPFVHHGSGPAPSGPSSYQQPPSDASVSVTQATPPKTSQSSASVPSASTKAPTTDTPSGPIASTAGDATPLPPPPSSNPPSLEPPPDPPPASR